MHGGVKVRIIFKKEASKTLNRCDKAVAARIMKAIAGLMNVPPDGDIRPMEGYPKNTYRLRVGGYRVVYSIDGDTIIVQKVGARGDIYK